MQWIFPFAVTLHSFEEAVFLPNWVAAHSRRLPLHPGPIRIWLGLLLLTLAAYAVTYLSARKGRGSVWTYLLFGYAVAMLANVFLPHLPATLIYGEYTPGIVTAVFINLPVISTLLWKAADEEWVAGAKAIAYAMLVPLSLGATILALFGLS
jgi:Protein of unknown function with HXXEE motif